MGWWGEESLRLVEGSPVVLGADHGEAGAGAHGGWWAL